MKTEIDASIEQYGQENAPPPWSVFTMPNAVGPGNMHIVQKVFEGPFEFDIIYSSGSAESPVTCKAILWLLLDLWLTIQSRRSYWSN